MLDSLIEGHKAAELYIPAIDRHLVSRLDHAAYLGRELARAEHALLTGTVYVQDAAPEQEVTRWQLGYDAAPRREGAGYGCILPY